MHPNYCELGRHDGEIRIKRNREGGWLPVSHEEGGKHETDNGHEFDQDIH